MIHMCVADVVKGINVKLFSLMSRTNEWHECRMAWNL